MIAELHPQIEPLLVRLQSFPNLWLIDVIPADLTAMHENMRHYHLRPRDALHLAAMQKVNCLEIVSQDTDFDAVPGLQRHTPG